VDTARAIRLQRRPFRSGPTEAQILDGRPAVTGSADAAHTLELNAQFIQRELKRVKRLGEQLEYALDDVDHDVRRCSDALERLGGRSAELEQRMAVLQDNRRAILADQNENRAACRELTRRLASVERRLGKLGPI